MATEKLLKLSQVSIIKADSDASYLGIHATADAAAKLSNTAAIGSAANPVYFTAAGVPSACTYELNKTVPADAVFTDTTYDEATQSAAGLMSAADKTKLDGIEAGAEVNVLEGITVGGTAQTPADKVIALGSAAGASVEATVANDSGLPTGAAVMTYVNGLDFQTSSDVDSAISTALATVLDWKGVVADMTALNAISSPKTGDVYHVTASGSEYAWNGSAWEELGLTFDATGFVQESDIVYATDDEVRAALGQTV